MKIICTESIEALAYSLLEGDIAFVKSVDLLYERVRFFMRNFGNELLELKINKIENNIYYFDDYQFLNNFDLISLCAYKNNILYRNFDVAKRYLAKDDIAKIAPISMN